jgi:hypothetical protein
MSTPDEHSEALAASSSCVDSQPETDQKRTFMRLQGFRCGVPVEHGIRVASLLRFANWICTTAFTLGICGAASGQSYSGELRVTVADATGRPLQATVTVTGEGFERSLYTNSEQAADVKPVPFGIYRITASSPGFAPLTETVDMRSAIPLDRALTLRVAATATTVQVNAEPETGIGPYLASQAMQIGAREIRDRPDSLPGRSVQDLVNSQPGWLYEGNAVLHPRGSEYQTQFVIDGIPLTDNRSPSFGPEIEADDLSSIRIYTAGIPAEYGRKMGGVVELNTERDRTAGTHGQVDLSGGTYATVDGYAHVQQVQGRNTFAVSAAGGRTDRYLNPVVPENHTNRGTTGDFSGSYERDLSINDELKLTFRHELSRFLIPDELLQEQAGQEQSGDNFESMGTVRFQHVLSPNALYALAGMVRDDANDLSSNASSTPILAFQHNHFREGYFNGSVSAHKGRQELKAGIESDNTFLEEHFNYDVTDPTQFDSDTPASLAFSASRPDLEQSAYVQDQIRLGNWILSVGLRWDHYQLLLNQQAFSPRLSAGRFFPRLNLELHGSYDRVFQTPSFENILISSSPQIQALSGQFLRLPVQPSHGNYFEGGATESIARRIRLEANLYRRNVNNYADDDQLLNTGVSYPIAFSRAVIYGAEAKLSLMRVGRLSGFASYSYMVGVVWYPVTGGLFLGDDAASALVQTAGHFPDSQDQRNTMRARFQYQVAPRFWLAGGSSFDSGLPFEYTGEQDDALKTYGPAVVDRLNFARGRILPSLAVNAGAGIDLNQSEPLKVSLQADGENLNGRLNILDFGGLFSGNAIAPGRSFMLRLKTSF